MGLLLNRVFSVLVFSLFSVGCALAVPARPGEKILFIGSSTIGHWTTLNTDFPGYRSVNAGLNGSTYQYVIDSAPDFMKREHPDRIVMYSGDNDLGYGETPQKVANDFEKAVGVVRRVSPRVIVDVISVKPSPGRQNLLPAIRATNVLLQRSATRLNVRYVDMFSPMMSPNGQIRRELFDESDESLLHMNAKGYELWAEIMRTELRR